MATIKYFDVVERHCPCHGDTYATCEGDQLSYNHTKEAFHYRVAVVFELSRASLKCSFFLHSGPRLSLISIKRQAFGIALESFGILLPLSDLYGIGIS